jgi:hypothetical protein
MPPPNVSVSIINVLMDAVTDRLEKVLITDATDDAKAGLVRKGRLQDDPTKTKITVLVHPGTREFPHILNRENEGPAMFAPVYEIGGGDHSDNRSFQGTVTLRRRIVVQLSLFFPNSLDRERAQIISNVVLSRAMWAIFSMEVPPTVDDFGEMPTGQLQILDNYIEESGGRGTFIWRGEIQTEFMTIMAPV